MHLGDGRALGVRRQVVKGEAAQREADRRVGQGNGLGPGLDQFDLHARVPDFGAGSLQHARVGIDADRPHAWQAAFGQDEERGGPGAEVEQRLPIPRPGRGQHPRRVPFAEAGGSGEVIVEGRDTECG